MKKILNLKSRPADLDSFVRTRDSSTRSGDDLVVGTSGPDVLKGTSAGETLSGGPGHDTINGGSGNDAIDGGKEGDQLIGNAGNDTINGGSGYDNLQGNDGKDVLDGGSYNDTLNGNAGNDTLTGGSGSDQFILSRGRDVITDLEKKDRIVIDQALIGIPGQDGPFLKESRKLDGAFLLRTNKGIRTRIEASGLSMEEVSNLIEIRMSDPEKITASDGIQEEFQLEIGEVKEIDNFNFDEGDRLLLPNNRKEISRSSYGLCGKYVGLSEWWQAPHYRIVHENNSNSILIQYSEDINTQDMPDPFSKDYYNMARVDLNKSYNFSEIDRGVGSIFKEISSSLPQNMTAAIVWLQSVDDVMFGSNSAGTNYHYVLGESTNPDTFYDLSPWYYRKNSQDSPIDFAYGYGPHNQNLKMAGGGTTVISDQADDYLDGRDRDVSTLQCEGTKSYPVNTWWLSNGDNVAVKTFFLGGGDDFVYLAYAKKVSGFNDIDPSDYGDNVIHGQEGSDSLFGGHASDTIDGGAGNDLLSGIGLKLENRRPDNLTEETAKIQISVPVVTDFKPLVITTDYPNKRSLDDDLLLGGAGDDTLYATTGSDTLDGGDGNDQLIAIEPQSTEIEPGDHLFNLSRGTDLIDLTSIQFENFRLSAPFGWSADVQSSDGDDLQLPQEYSTFQDEWSNAEQKHLIQLVDREGNPHTTYLMSKQGEIVIEEGDYEDGYEPDTIIIDEPTANPKWDLNPEEQKWINRCTLEVNGVFELGPKDDILTTNPQIQAEGLDGKGGFDSLILTDDYQCSANDKISGATSMDIRNFENIEQEGGQWQFEGDHSRADVLISGGTMQVPLLRRSLAGLNAKSFQLKDGGAMTVDLSDTDISSNGLDGTWVVLQANGLANSLANTSLDDVFNVIGAADYDTQFKLLGSKLILELSSSSVG